MSATDAFTANFKQVPDDFAKSKADRSAEILHVFFFLLTEMTLSLKAQLRTRSDQPLAKQRIFNLRFS